MHTHTHTSIRHKAMHFRDTWNDLLLWTRNKQIAKMCATFFRSPCLSLCPLSYFFGVVVVSLFLRLADKLKSIQAKKKSANLNRMSVCEYAKWTKRKKNKWKKPFEIELIRSHVFYIISLHVSLYCPRSFRLTCLSVGLFPSQIHFLLPLCVELNKVGVSAIDIFYVIKCSRLKTWNVWNFSILICLHCVSVSLNILFLLLFTCFARILSSLSFCPITNCPAVLFLLSRPHGSRSLFRFMIPYSDAYTRVFCFAAIAVASRYMTRKLIAIDFFPL